MDKMAVIKALRVGLDEAINIIKYLDSQDPGVKHSLEQLQQLLTYSESIYDTKTHPVYDN